MSVDKLVDSTQLDSDLTSIANAIRAKSGTTNTLSFPSDFVSEINAIPSGGGINLPAIVAAIWGTIASSSYVDVGNGAKSEYGVITDYFTYASGVFTCVTAGTYTAYMCARGGYNNQGTARYAHYKLTVNGTDVYVQDSNVAGNGGDSGSYPITLSVNDTIEMKGKTNSGTNTSDYCLIIMKTT